MVQIIIGILTIITASIFAFKQNQINENILNLNFRILIDIRYEDKSGIIKLYNYGNLPICIGVVRLNTARNGIDTPNKTTIPIQKTIFLNQSVDIDFKKQFEIFFSGIKDGDYAGFYEMLVQADNQSGKKLYIGRIAFGMGIRNGKIEYIIPSNNVSLSDYTGTYSDFINIK
ncbi:MAG: hypothetical protein QG589_355 [Patescibacteria group bacterium]|nr:hypothetical protein [Patescibacteria group bacterium]